MEDLFKDIILIIVALAAVLLNIVEIVLILRIKNKKAFDKLLLSLAVSDTAVGMVYSSLKICEIAITQRLPWQSMDFCQKFLGLSLLYSVGNLLAISLDRLLAVKYPIKHRTMLTNRRANIAIILLWVLTTMLASFCGLIAFQWPRTLKYLLNTTKVLFIVYGVLLVAIYSHIFYLICKRKVLTAASVFETSSARIRGFALFTRRPFKAELTILFTGATVTVTFIICTYPSAFEFLIKQNSKFSFASMLMLLLNSVLNPIIYFFKSYICSRRERTANILMKTL